MLGIAFAVAERADCTRRKVGAVIASVDKRLVPGYNGVPAGQKGCLEGACPRGRHYGKLAEDHRGTLDCRSCGCGNDWPCPEYMEPGSSYDTGPGTCIGIHAEINAILRSSWELNQNAVIYVTSEPCDGCLKIIGGSGIKRAIWPQGRLDYPFLSYRYPSR